MSIERLKDADDARWLTERRKKPMSFRTLEEFLAERAAGVYGFSAAEMRKIAQNLHAEAKRRNRERTRQRIPALVPLTAFVHQPGAQISPSNKSHGDRRL